MNPSITIQLSAGRSVTFTAIGNRVQVTSSGFITARELAEAKEQAIQKLADAAGTTIQTFTPRRNQSGRAYLTRLANPQNKGGEDIKHTIGTQ